MRCTASETSGDARRDMPAGFDHSVLASSAAAAPPAKALPMALPEFSCSANPAPDACPLASITAMPLRAAATHVRLMNRDRIFYSLRVVRKREKPATNDLCPMHDA